MLLLASCDDVFNWLTVYGVSVFFSKAFAIIVAESLTVAFKVFSTRLKLFR